ncbi:MAG: GGDEF domain-containing protein [Ruminococcaceae bacterium]|nr:GGDEF domain-containing protein [Oscillospiraceae bacterium]
MKERWLRFWGNIDSLDDKIYYSIMLVGSFATVQAFILAVAQGLNSSAILTTVLAAGWMIGMLIYGVLHPDHLASCRVVLVVVLNFILLPPAFFSCGGLTSGMLLFYLMSLFLTAVLLRGRTRIVVFLLSLCVLTFSVYYGWRHPELVLTLTARQQFEDVTATFCTTGLALGVMVTGILNAYNAERKKREALMAQLTDLSVRDALSGLYNRRELFRRLELIYQPQERKEHLVTGGCFLAMFDVDNFKRLNDTYGHQFGDTVLKGVAQVLSDQSRHEDGEFAARYGGEEFICLLHADSAAEAYARADGIRQNVAALKWQDVPSLTVTVSGGLAACAEHKTLDLAIQNADGLLYKAKHAGKNRVLTDEVI